MCKLLIIFDLVSSDYKKLRIRRKLFIWDIMDYLREIALEGDYLSAEGLLVLFTNLTQLLLQEPS